MEWTEARNRWTQPVVMLLAIALIAVLLRPAHRSFVAPPRAIDGAAASAPPTTLQGRFEAQAASAAAAPDPGAGHIAVTTAGALALYTTDGSYSADVVAGLAGPMTDALSYVGERTGLSLAGPITIVFDRRASCGFDGAAYTQRRLIVLYTCPDVPTGRAVNILAHEFVHQLAQDHFGAAHLQADLALSEGFATWGAGKYWLGREPGFREFVAHNYAGGLLPLATDYRAIGTIDAMNRLYYEWAALVDFIIQTHGRDAFDRLYSSGKGVAPDTADYSGILGADLGQLDAQWQTWLTQ